MKHLYTAVFTADESGKVFASVPDLPGCVSSGRDMRDAIEQISDAASVWLVAAEDDGAAIPAPTPQHAICRDENSTLSVISIDTVQYRSLTDTRAVRKNVSLPAWMASLADKRGINCSQVLQDSLTSIFNMG